MEKQRLSGLAVKRFSVLRSIFYLLTCLSAQLLNRYPLSAQEKIFMPYYRFNFGEGVALPSKGDFFASHTVGSQVGGLLNATDWLHFFGLYDLTYQGPGLIRSEGELFTQRSMRHSFLIEPSFTIANAGKLRLKVFTIKEFRRSGTNETWGKGLYDYAAQGGSVGFEREFFGFRFFPAIRIMQMKFPNYTDLLREFQESGLSAELAGGLMDQNVMSYSLNISRKPFNVGVSLSSQKYKKEKVVGQGGVYTSDAQKDSVTEITADFDVSLWRFSLVPEGAYRMKRSNQNYLRFAYFGDPNPTFVPKNYDYNEMSVGGKLYLKMTEKKAIFGSIDLNNRVYPNRPPRNASGVYAAAGEMQNTTWGAWGGGIQWKVSDYSTWNLAYHMVYSKSNMKYDRFIPYNYTGNVVGLYLSVSP